jgi:hypothetical protein
MKDRNRYISGIIILKPIKRQKPIIIIIKTNANIYRSGIVAKPSKTK